MTTLAWSPDGQKIVTGHWLDSAMFLVWDAASGERLAASSWGGGLPRNATWLPDGDRLLITFTGALLMPDLAAPDSQPDEVTLYAAGNGMTFEQVESLDVSADGQRVVSTGYPGQESDVTVWNLQDGTIIATLEQSSGYSDNGVPTLAFSPDGTRVAVSSGAASFSYRRDEGVPTISLYDAATGERLHLLRGHEAGITQFAWSADGHYLVSSSRDGTARLWDVVTGEAVDTLVEGEGMLSSVAWSPDGETIAVGAVSGMIYLLKQG